MLRGGMPTARSRSASGDLPKRCCVKTYSLQSTASDLGLDFAPARTDSSHCVFPLLPELDRYLFDLAQEILWSLVGAHGVAAVLADGEAVGRGDDRAG